MMEQILIKLERAEPNRSAERNPENADRRSRKKTSISFLAHQLPKRLRDSESFIGGKIRGQHDARLQHVQRAGQKRGNAAR